MKDIQRQKLLHFFNLLDHDGNGVLQPNDFLLVSDNISDIMGYENNSTNRFELQLKAMGLFLEILRGIESKEAEVTPEKWLAYFHDKVFDAPNETIDKVARYLFDLFDQDNDGAIDEHEYLDMFKAYDLYSANAKMAFDQLDLNKDERISQGELIKAFEDFILSDDKKSPGNWLFGDWSKDLNA